MPYKDPEEKRAKRRADYEKNKDRVKAQTAAWKEANPEKQREYVRTWRAKNPEKVNEFDKRKSLKIACRGFSLTVGEYEAMLEAQDGKCAICLQPPKTGKNAKRLAIDHCHETGVVRGLLCFFCNSSLGKMADDPERLRRAADYVEASRQVRLDIAS